MATCRDDTLASFRHVQQVFARLGTSLVIHSWDYREELGETLAPGDLASRSLEEVRNADAIIGIFGKQVPLPEIARQELEEAYRRRRDGEDIYIAVAMKDPVSQIHRDWIRDVNRRYGIEIVFDKYKTRLDLQRRVYGHLLLVLFPRFAAAGGPQRGGQRP